MRALDLVRRFIKKDESIVHQAPVDFSVCFDVGEQFNQSWRASERGHRITTVKKPILHRRSKIFTMGSCFAVEIRAALEQRGFDVYPKYKEIAFDASRQKLSKLPRRDNLNHYDTFTIRQEFERTLAHQHFQLDDFLQHKHKLTNHFANGGRISWQDPYRRDVFAADEEAILDISRKIDECIAAGIRNSDVYIITLGLIETWRNTKNGLHICLPPYDDGHTHEFGYLQFHLSNYAENYANLSQVCRLINERYPGRIILFTVSPVGLARTQQDQDVVVATIEAKSILRAVCAQMCREFSNVVYWPSYELCVKDDIYRVDGRHVRDDVVAMIVDAFIRTHVEDAAPTNNKRLSPR